MVNYRPLLSCSKCKETFPYEDLKVKEKEMYGIVIKEKVCPFCNSSSYSNLRDAKWFDKYIMQNKIKHIKE